MIRRRGPPSQTWRTFLRSHAEAIAAIDLCVVPTLTFERLFAFLVLCLDHVPIFGERHRGGSWLYILRIAIRRARTWHWARMRRYGEQSKVQELLLPRQFCSECITTTRDADHDRPSKKPTRRSAPSLRVYVAFRRCGGSEAS